MNQANCKWILSIALLFGSFKVGACPPALPTSSSGFCASFVTAAQCRCSATLPPHACADIYKIYRMMVARYGSVDAACASQHETSKQTCLDDWSCTLAGGRDSHNELCSGTGAGC